MTRCSEQLHGLVVVEHCVKHPADAVIDAHASAAIAKPPREHMVASARRLSSPFG